MRHHTVCKTQGPIHDCFTILDSRVRVEGHASRRSALRALVSGGVRDGEGPEVERLPEEGPSRAAAIGVWRAAGF